MSLTKVSSPFIHYFHEESYNYLDMLIVNRRKQEKRAMANKNIL